MNGYEVFGNVILMTTKEKTMQVREAVEAGGGSRRASPTGRPCSRENAG